MKKLLLILMLFAQSGVAQKNLDSLWSVWENSSEVDTNRLQAIFHYTWYGFLFSNPDSAYVLAQQQYDFAKKVDNKQFMGDAILMQGVSYYFTDKYDLAIEKYEECSEIFNEIGDEVGAANALSNMANIYSVKGDFANAIDIYGEVLITREKLNDRLGVSSSLNNIGILYSDQNEPDEAYYYYRRSLNVSLEADDDMGVARAYNNIGLLLKEQGDLDSAEYYYTLGLDIKRKSNDLRGLSKSLNLLGSVFLERKDYDKAESYYQESYTIRLESESKRGQTESLNNLAKVYLERGDISKAINLGEKALALAAELEALTETRNSVETLWRCYQASGNYKLALSTYEKYVELDDSITREENQNEVIRHKYKYEYQKKAATDSIQFLADQQIKDAEIAQQNAEIAQQDAEIKTNTITKYLLLSGIAVLVFLALFLVYRFRNIRVQKELIEKQKKLDMSLVLSDNKMRHEFNEKISKQLDQIKKADDQEWRSEIQSLQLELRQQMLHEGKMETITENLDQLHSEFDQKLREKFPSLTPTEIEICHLIRLNMSAKEIANHRYSTVGAVRATRHRIKKKLGLEDVSIEDFLKDNL